MEATGTLEDAARLMARDQLSSWHPFARPSSLEWPLPVVAARGAELYLGDGTTLIDAISSWWVNIHGHGHPVITEAIADQAAKLDHVSFSDLTHEPAVRLAERLSELLPGRPQRIFYSDNGSTAVETALKIAVGRGKTVAFRNGYHGETAGAMSVSCQSLFSKPFAPYLFSAEWIDPPYVGAEEKSIEQLRKLLATEKVGAFIFEPWVQAAGGMRSHSLEGLSELLELCREWGVWTIADEVFTGCGRLGPNFASDRLSCPPDMICLAKSLTGGVLPLGVTTCSEAIFEEVSPNFVHGHSYCGNAVGCAAALASLELLSDKQRQRIEARHRRAAAQFAQCEHFSRVEVIGTLLVLEYRERCPTTSFWVERGVLLRPLGRVLYVLPPYCVTDGQLDAIYETIEESLHVI